MALIVDIRREEDYQKLHNLRSVRIAPTELYDDSPGLNAVKRMKPDEVLLMGDNIKTAEEYRSFLSGLSWQPKVEVYKGGMEAWVNEGKPYLSYPMLFGNIRLNPPVFFLSLVAMLLVISYLISMTVIMS